MAPPQGLRSDSLQSENVFYVAQPLERLGYTLTIGTAMQPLRAQALHNALMNMAVVLLTGLVLLAAVHYQVRNMLSHLEMTRRAVLDLPEDVIELLVSGEISAGHGRALLMLDDKSKAMELAEKAANGEMTVRQLEDAVRRENKNSAKEQKEAAETEEVKVNYLRAIEERFTGITGRRCKIADKKRGVKTLTLEYRDDGDLEELLKKLAGDDVFKDF